MIVKSRFDGIEYEMDVRVQEDSCHKCGGEGHIRFSTFADLREYVPLMYEYDISPKQNGKRVCERCNGSGVFVGDGPKYTFACFATTTVFK